MTSLTSIANDWTAFTYQFGAETSSANCYCSVVGNYVKLVPWELKHVTNFSTSVSGSTSTVGIANCPAECVMIYDTGGPVRNFQISGIRLDEEEDVSNYDFIHQQFSKRQGRKVGFVPFRVGEQQNLDGGYSIGIEWLESRMQMLNKGYVFRATKVNDSVDDRRLEEHDFIVGLTGFSYSLASGDYSQMAYSLTFSQRVSYPLLPAYKGYISPYVRKTQGEEEA